MFPVGRGDQFSVGTCRKQGPDAGEPGDRFGLAAGMEPDAAFAVRGVDAFYTGCQRLFTGREFEEGLRRSLLRDGADTAPIIGDEQTPCRIGQQLSCRGERQRNLPPPGTGFENGLKHVVLRSPRCDAGGPVLPEPAHRLGEYSRGPDVVVTRIAPRVVGRIAREVERESISWLASNQWPKSGFQTSCTLSWM